MRTVPGGGRGAASAEIPALCAREGEEGTWAYARSADWISSRQWAREDLPNPNFYVRRPSSSMGSGDEASRLRLGLAAAAILEEREDYRVLKATLREVSSRDRRVRDQR